MLPPIGKPVRNKRHTLQRIQQLVNAVHILIGHVFIKTEVFKQLCAVKFIPHHCHRSAHTDEFIHDLAHFPAAENTKFMVRKRIRKRVVPIGPFITALRDGDVVFQKRAQQLFNEFRFYPVVAVYKGYVFPCRRVKPRVAAVSG